MTKYFSGSASRLSSFRRFGKQHVNVDNFVPYVQDRERDIPLPRPTPSEPISLRRELKDSHDDFLLAFDSPYPTESCIYCVQFSSRFILPYYECKYVDETIYLLSKSRKLVVRHNNRSGLWFGGVFHNLWHTRVSNTLSTICQFYLTNRYSVCVERNAEFNRWKKLTWNMFFIS